jgi:hypothetical protein
MVKGAACSDLAAQLVRVVVSAGHVGTCELGMVSPELPFNHGRSGCLTRLFLYLACYLNGLDRRQLCPPNENPDQSKNNSHGTHQKHPSCLPNVHSCHGEPLSTQEDK